MAEPLTFGPPIGDVLIDSVVAAPPPDGPVKAGFKAGVAGLKSGLYGFGALAAHGAGAAAREITTELGVPTGAVTSALTGMERAALDNQAEQAKLASPEGAPTWEGVNDLSSGADWAKYTAANFVPTLATMAVGGGAVGLGAKALGVAAEAAPGMLALAKNVGAMASITPSSIGDVYARAKETGVEDPELRAIAGGIGGVLPYALPLGALHKFGAKAGGGAVVGALKGAAVGAPLVGVEEVAAEGVMRAAAGQNLTDAEARRAYSETLAAALLFGGAGGAAVGAHRGMKPSAAKPTSTEPNAPITVEEAPASPLGLPNIAGEPMVTFPDGSTMTRAEYNQRQRDGVMGSGRVDPTPAPPIAEQAPKDYSTPQERLAAELSDLTISEGRDAEFRRAEMQRSQQKAAELDAIAAARTEELGRTPEQQTEAARVATDEMPTAMAEAFARAQQRRAAPLEAGKIQEMGAQEAADLVRAKPAAEIAAVLPDLKLDHAADILTRLDEPLRNEVIAQVDASEKAAAAPTPSEAAAAAHVAAGGDPAKAPVVAERAYPRAQAEAYAARMTAQGLPSEAVPHPTESGKYAIAPTGRVKEAAETDAGAAGRAEETGRAELRKHVSDTIAAKSISAAKKAEYDAHVQDAIDAITTEARATPEAYRAAFIKEEVRKRVGMRLPADVKADIVDHIDTAANTQFSRGAMSYETILAKQRAFEGMTAAVRDPQTGEIYTGPSHRQAISFAPNDPALRARLARAVDQDASMKNVGFIDAAGEFIPRAQAEKMMYSQAAMDQATFDSLPEPAKQAAVEAFDNVMREKASALTARLEEIIGAQPGLKVETFTAKQGGPIGSYTRVDAHKAIISMALNAKDGLSVADHEGFHYAEGNLLSGAERQIIVNALKAGRPTRTQLMERLQQYDRANQTNLSDEVAGSPAEAHAYAFEFWRRGELKADGALARTFEKFRQFFEKIANAVRGLGFKSMEDIFTALDRGQYANREAAASASTYRDLARIIKEMQAGKVDPGTLAHESSTAAVASMLGKELKLGKARVADLTLAALAHDAGKSSIPSEVLLANRKLTEAEFARVKEHPAAGHKMLTEAGVPSNISEIVLHHHRGFTEAGYPAATGEYRTFASQILHVADVVAAIGKQDAGHPYVEGAGVQKALDHMKASPKIFNPEIVAAFEKMVAEGRVPGEFRNKAGIDPTLQRLKPEERALYSKAAVEAERNQKTREQAGELERNQTQRATMHVFDDAGIHEASFKAAFDISKEAMMGAGGSLKRWWQANIATPNFIAQSSAGYKNVYQTLNTYIRYRAILSEQMLREKLPGWYKASDADRKAAFKVMLDRTVAGHTKDSTELRAALATLTPEQHKLYEQATGMIEGFLRAQFAKDQINRKKQLTSEGAYEKWETARKAQVEDMIAKGYVPLRRYGDYSVRVFAITPDGKRVDGGLMFFDSEARAKIAAKLYQDEITRSGANLQVEMGIRSKNLRDTGVSIEQFLGTLQRNGVDISQAERERLVMTFTNAESMLRNKMMHREGLPGYSADSMRVLHEFGVNMSGELAYSKFATAIDAAVSGAEVKSDVNSTNSEPMIQVGENFGMREDGVAHNLWERDGPMSGFYRNLSDELSNYVLVPDHSGAWSKRLRAGAMAYFIGGSLSAGAVNVMSVPMMVVPQLSIHTNYIKSLTHTMSAWKDAWQHYGTLRDMEKMKDPNTVIPGISKELRQAIVAAADHIFDTEIHQMLGMSQGTMYSKSRNVQRAMEAWMAPFRVSEQTNRLAAFISAYRIASEDGVRQPDGSLRKLSGQELFKFASEIVDATQNNYNESNRPGAARNPVFALMFMFKSFPLFMVEATALMYKQNPRAAVNMLLGLTAMTGVQGLPFAGTIEDIIDTISQQLFGSPFNTRRAMRNVIKDASEAIVGADLSELVMHGIVNDLTGISVSSRIGAGDFVPGSRLGTADADQGRILSQIAGAPYAMVHDAVKNVGGAISGIASGDWKKTADAMRAGGPIAVRNAIKGAEQVSSGYASDSKGRRIVEVSTLDGMLQMGGLSSAAVAKMYDLESINIQTKAFYTQVSQDMQNQLVNALRDGDVEQVQRITDLRNAWNQQYPQMPILVNAASVRRAVALAGVPLDRRSQMQWARQIRGNNVFAEQNEE
jgi:HD-GYP domain-containing protein (c-di-GMP phosphodiesterase class II)